MVNNSLTMNGPINTWEKICQKGDIDAAEKFLEDQLDLDLFCRLGCETIANTMALSNPLNHQLLNFIKYLHEKTAFSVCYADERLMKCVIVLCGIDKCKWLLDMCPEDIMEWVSLLPVVRENTQRTTYYVTLEYIEWLMKQCGEEFIREAGCSRRVCPDDEFIKQCLQHKHWVICAVESLPAEDLRTFMSWIIDPSAHVLSHMFQKEVSIDFSLDGNRPKYARNPYSWDKIRLILELCGENLDEITLKNIFCYICKNHTLEEMKWFWNQYPDLDIVNINGGEETYHKPCVMDVISPILLDKDVILEPIAGACYRGDLESIKWLLQVAPDTDVHKNGNRLMSIACRMDHTPIIQWYLNTYDVAFYVVHASLFFESLGKDPLRTLRIFMDHFPQDDWRIEMERLFVCSICYNRMDVVVWILENTGVLKEVNDKMCLAYFMAAYLRKHWEIVDLLLDHLSSRDSWTKGCIFLKLFTSTTMEPCYPKSSRIMRKVFALMKDYESINMVLAVLIKEGDLEIIKLAMEMFPNLDLSYNDYEALKDACYYNHLPVLQCLLELVPAPTAETWKGMFRNCFMAESLSVLGWLIETQPEMANIHCSSEAFTFLCREGKLKAAKYLYPLIPKDEIDYRDLLRTACLNGEHVTARWLYSLSPDITSYGEVLATPSNRDELIELVKESKQLHIHDNCKTRNVDVKLHGYESLEKWLS